MLDKEFYIAGLIKRQLDGELDEKGSKEFRQWLTEHPSNYGFFTTLTNPENFHHKLSEFESADSEVLWSLTQAKIANGRPVKIEQETRIIKHRWFRLVTAAAALIFIVSAGIWFYKYSHTRDLAPTVYSSDVRPGHQGATLTLSNGKKISLTEAAVGALATENGVIISKTADGQLVYNMNDNSENSGYHTLSTEKGETFQVRLPDGSKVWLNAVSSLTYSAGMIVAGKRDLKLTGEGYFQVARDRAHPFRVQTGDQLVEVLGTHFNINSYSNEPAITTTLLEGAVQVSYPGKKEVLRPGQQVKLDDKGTFKITQVDTGTYVAWKDRQFSFENENIQTIMRMVERWYGVKIEYSGAISEEKFWGGVSRSDNLSKVLSALESTGKVHFEIENNTVYVFKNDR
jgi:transmembrane sensor